MPRLHSLLVAALLASAAVPAVAQDRKGADHPLLPRFEGADIIDYRGASLDEIFIPTATIADQDQPRGVQLEGQVTHIDYRLRPAASPLAVARHYEAVLGANGFETVFSCTNRASCGRDMDALISNSGKVAPVGLADGVFSDRARVIVARRGDDWVLIRADEASDRSLIYTAIVEQAVAAGS